MTSRFYTVGELIKDLQQFSSNSHVLVDADGRDLIEPSAPYAAEPDNWRCAAFAEYEQLTPDEQAAGFVLLAI